MPDDEVCTHELSRWFSAAGVVDGGHLVELCGDCMRVVRVQGVLMDVAA